MTLQDVHKVVLKPGDPIPAITNQWPANCWAPEQKKIIDQLGYTAANVELWGGKSEEGKMVLLVVNRNRFRRYERKS